MIAKSDDLFLLAFVTWSAFVQDVVRWTPRLIEQRLKELKVIPARVEEIYCNVLEKLPTDYQPLLRDIFAWLSVAREPLTIEDLNCALFVSSLHRRCLSNE